METKFIYLVRTLYFEGFEYHPDCEVFYTTSLEKAKEYAESYVERNGDTFQSHWVSKLLSIQVWEVPLDTEMLPHDDIFTEAPGLRNKRVWEKEYNDYEQIANDRFNRSYKEAMGEGDD